ncbi:helix-turn-helix domain-containing protein [Domibacillus indicus]|uniref:helix-turn-helix domain-containing protein n=1 Tax=Domibacillus indicus TaxID=1437523 RepID=UPI002041173A|nr:helix-turn-helix domain-containing protein [Domibacillus indicus]MCM3786903.1 helix-turn-helix domain-containing protein [Domibacillus indicus]
MFSWFGLGKSRTKFGRFIDEKGITQSELTSKSKVSHATISRMCNDDDYIPKYATLVKVKKAIEAMGYRLPKDFLD